MKANGLLLGNIKVVGGDGLVAREDSREKTSASGEGSVLWSDQKRGERHSEQNAELQRLSISLVELMGEYTGDSEAVSGSTVAVAGL